MVETHCGSPALSEKFGSSLPIDLYSKIQAPSQDEKKANPRLPMQYSCSHMCTTTTTYYTVAAATYGLQKRRM